MRPTSVSVVGIGNSPWLPVDYLENYFNLGLFVTLSEDAATNTAVVQLTPDQIQLGGTVNQQDIVSIARAATVATVTFAQPHLFVTGDSLIVQGSGSPQLDSQIGTNGQPIAYDIASTPSTTTLTYAVANAGPTASGMNTVAWGQRVFAHATLTALTARAMGQQTTPVRMVRLKTSAGTGTVTLTVLQSSGR